MQWRHKLSFTKETVKGFKPLGLTDSVIPMSEEGTYLIVNFDQKVTWNTHIQRGIKALMTIGRCRKLCGKNWVLYPKMVIYKNDKAPYNLRVSGVVAKLARL